MGHAQKTARAPAKTTSELVPATWKRVDLYLLEEAGEFLEGLFLVGPRVDLARQRNACQLTSSGRRRFTSNGSLDPTAVNRQPANRG
eukprot:150208-Rhodomonas_salina.1